MKLAAWKRLFEDILFVATREKKWWLAPLILFLLFIVFAMAIAALAGPLAPFIYPLF